MENYVCTLQEALAENFVTQVLCGYSTEKSGVSGIVEGYKEAVSALNNTKILSKNNVGYALVYKMKRNQFALSSLQMKELQYNIEKCNYDVSESIIRNLFKEMLLKNVDYECIANNCNHLLRVITDIALVFGLDIKSFMNGFNNFEAAFIQMNNMDEIINWFVNITQGMIVSKLQVSSQNKNLLIVEKVREYILNHYQNIELSQTLIAEEMYVSPAYISGSFKKVVGMSMMQYITMIRLEKAKEILMLTDNDVRTTAIEVGYGDEYYFSRCFKKYFGYAPSTVKKQEDQNRQMKP